MKCRIFFPNTQYYFSTIFVEFPFQLVSFPIYNQTWRSSEEKFGVKKVPTSSKAFFLFLFSAKHKRHPLQVLFIPPFCCSFFTTLTQQLCALLCWAKGIVSKEKKYLFGFSSFHPLIYDCGAHYMRSIEILKIKNIERSFFCLRFQEKRIDICAGYVVTHNGNVDV